MMLLQTCGLPPPSALGRLTRNEDLTSFAPPTYDQFEGRSDCINLKADDPPLLLLLLTLQLSSWLHVGRDGGPLADVAIVVMMAAVALLPVTAFPRGALLFVSGAPSPSDLCHLPRGRRVSGEKSTRRGQVDRAPGPCEQGYIWPSSSTRVQRNARTCGEQPNSGGGRLPQKIGLKMIHYGICFC